LNRLIVKLCLLPGQIFYGTLSAPFFINVTDAMDDTQYYT
jgi:hypothetical protein